MAVPAVAHDPPATELQAARLVASGALPSPTKFGDMVLMSLRVTGTGLAYRAGLKEYVWRDPAIFTSNEFLARCAGLPVVWQHPDAGVLNSDEFAGRVVGALMFAWVQSGEVWSVARLYDRDAIAALASSQLSTSPAVVFAETDDTARLESNAGTALLIEGRPALLSHLAICERGVWDKTGPAAGVRADESKGTAKMDGDMTMTDNTAGGAAKADLPSDASPDAMARLMAVLGDLCGRLDGMCNRLDSLEKAGAQPAPGDLPDASAQVAADGAAPNAGDRDRQRYMEDQRRGAAMAAQGRMSIEDEQEQNRQLAQAQSRADRACIEFGKRAEPPMVGESVAAYRRRLMRPLKQYCADYRDVDIDGINDPKMLDVIETRVYADAVKAARNCEHLPDDQAHPVTKTEGGRTITTWHGKRSFIHDVKAPTMRVTAFHMPRFQDGRAA